MLAHAIPCQTQVILDAGHGGQDAGAVYKLNQKSIYEKDLTLEFALQAKKALEKKNFSVLLTRQTDQLLGLDDRIRLVNAAKNQCQQSFLVSLHLNSNPNRKIRGMETYVLNTTTNEASQRLADLENQGRWGKKGHSPLDLILSDVQSTGFYPDSVRLGCVLQRYLSPLVHKPSSTLKNALFYLLMQAHVPSVLVEIGFATSPKELARLIDPSIQKQWAERFAEGIADLIQLQGRPLRRRCKIQH